MVRRSPRRPARQKCTWVRPRRPRRRRIGASRPRQTTTTPTPQPPKARRSRETRFRRKTREVPRAIRWSQHQTARRKAAPEVRRVSPQTKCSQTRTPAPAPAPCPGTGAQYNARSRLRWKVLTSPKPRDPRNKACTVRFGSCFPSRCSARRRAGGRKGLTSASGRNRKARKRLQKMKKNPSRRPASSKPRRNSPCAWTSTATGSASFCR
mmetsp:Transcript_9529/g.35476  ORF Transcript_9529/g.35476 Transcript_9529/m.35476 type:complete len:209 (+) Transcript_9529:3885-4511(+)